MGTQPILPLEWTVLHPPERDAGLLLLDPFRPPTWPWPPSLGPLSPGCSNPLYWVLAGTPGPSESSANCLLTGGWSDLP